MRFFIRAKHILWAVVALFSVLFILSLSPTYRPSEIEYGVTFSSKQSRNLGLDWRAVYLAMLDDLNIQKLRLPVYWDELEQQRGQYNWNDLDWQIDQAEKRNIELILAVGQRVPRWPECHLPNWVNDLSEQNRQAATIEHIKQTISRYKNRPSVRIWEVENEPFLPYFGMCPPFKKDFLDQEIKEVRSLDTRPILITDSGELSTWVMAAKRGDIFGTTMYRDTYSRALHSYIHYPITPTFFKVKKNLANLFAAPADWIVIELQGEPWGREAFQTLTQAERDRTMNQKKFKEMVSFSQQSGFKTFYWWGVEFWYWEKQKGNSFYWDEAKKLFNPYGKS